MNDFRVCAIVARHSPRSRKVDPVNQLFRGQGVFIAAMAAFGLCLSLTGCQTTVGGQTLPSPGYLNDDVQYHPHGPENQLTNTIAAQKLYRSEQDRLHGDAF